MDYTTMRGLFFAPPNAPRPPSPAGAHHTPARRLRDAIEPLACLSIWSPEAAEDYASLGLDDYFAAYVWQRTAALGTPPTALAVTALGVFAPDLVGPVYEKGAAALSRADVVRIRLDAPGRTVRRELGAIDADAARAVGLLRRGIDAAESTARPLFTGLGADPWPRDPLAALVHACHLLREHRGVRTSPRAPPPDSTRYRATCSPSCGAATTCSPTPRRGAGRPSAWTPRSPRCAPTGWSRAAG